jgi:hypothetical protein
MISRLENGLKVCYEQKACVTFCVENYYQSIKSFTCRKEISIKFKTTSFPRMQLEFAAIENHMQVEAGSPLSPFSENLVVTI